MAEILKRRRLVNPGRRRRKMTAKQIRFFGTKAQRAGLKRRRKSNYGTREGRSWSSYTPRKRRRKNTSIRHQARMRMRYGPAGRSTHPGFLRKKYKGKARQIKRLRAGKRSRRKNIGEILTVHVNPGRRKGMARRRRKNRARVVHHRRRRRAVSHRRRRRNPVYAVAPRRRRRRMSNRRRSYHRRRNPGMLSGVSSGIVGKAVGVGGGYVLTRIIASQLPAQFTTGVLGYLGIGVAAFAQGKLVGKIAKNPSIGNEMVVGGLVFLLGKIMSDYFPSFSTGLGLIAPSSFYTPQVPLPGMMGNFVVPSAIPTMAPSGMHGLGGRMAQRRGGRLQ